MSNTQQQPTRENLKTYEALMQEFTMYAGGDFHVQTDLYNKAQTYYVQFNWFCTDFEENGKFGLKDVFGTVVVPARYDAICTFPAYDYIGTRPIVVKKDGLMGLVRVQDGEAKEVTDCAFSAAFLIEYTHFTAVQMPGSDKWGLVDFNGRMVVPMEMDSIQAFPVNGNIFLSKRGKQGVYAFFYDAFVAPEYDSIDGVGEGGLLTFTKDGVEGCVDITGKFYPRELLDRFYEGELYDAEGNLIYDGEDEEPVLLFDHLD